MTVFLGPSRLPTLGLSAARPAKLSPPSYRAIEADPGVRSEGSGAHSAREPERANDTESDLRILASVRTVTINRETPK